MTAAGCPTCLAAATGGIAGVLITSVRFASCDAALLMGVYGFVAAMIGGFGSLQGAVYGGLIVGVLQQLAARYVSSEFADVVVFTLLLVFLVALEDPMMAPDLTELARRLWTAERTGVPIPPLSSDHPDLTISDAYAIQRHGHELRETGPLVGRKVGLTSPAMQEMLGIDQPDFGGLRAPMLRQTGARLDVGGLIAPQVEGEVAFVLAQELTGPDVTPDGVLAATRAVMPALEIIDSRIADWAITSVDTIADNASSALAVLGEPRPVDGLDLPAVELTLSVGSATEGGRGDAVLGDPAASVAWLANELARYGERLRAGDVVISGALGRALPFAAGQSAEAEFGALGRVAVEFA